MILMIKNGMPYLPQALKSLELQTYQNFELVVQDCCSTDGSLELIKKYADLNLFSIKVESAKDSGIGDAFNKAICRCQGDIIGSIDSDNLLETNALDVIVNKFNENLDAAVIYSAQKMINVDGHFLHHFFPKPFNIVDFLECRLVPPFGSSFFLKKKCEEFLYSDPSLKTCADFHIWLNLYHLKILSIPDVLVSTRISQASMTCCPENYDQMCQDKILGVQKFFNKVNPNIFNEILLRRSIVGIYVWAAESIKFFFPSSDPNSEKYYESFFQKAREIDSSSPRLHELNTRLSDLSLNNHIKQLQDTINQLEKRLALRPTFLKYLTTFSVK